MPRTNVAIFAPTPAPSRAYEYDRLGEALADQIEFKAYFLEANQSDMGWTDDRFPQIMAWEAMPQSPIQDLLRKLPKLGSIRINSGVSARLNNWNPDVVYLHAYDSPTQWLSLRWALKNHKRILYRSDSNALAITPPDDVPLLRKPLAAIKRKLLRYLYSKVDTFLTVGSRNEEYFVLFGVPADKLYRACFLFDDEKVHQIAQAHSGQAHSGQAGDETTFLYVGRLVPIKNVDVLIRAFQKLRKDRPAVKLVIVGDGCERNSLEALAGQAADGIEFTGYLDLPEIAAHYGKASVFVLPSHREPWGFVVCEAMAAGLPLIVTDFAGVTQDMVVEGVTGLAIPPGDIDALQLAMSKLAGAEDLGKWGDNSRTHWLNWRDTYDVAEQTRRAVMDIPSLIPSEECVSDQQLSPRPVR